MDTPKYRTPDNLIEALLADAGGTSAPAPWQSIPRYPKRS